MGFWHHVVLLTPNAQAAAKAAGETVPFASGNWLIGTYLILTFGELLLSPMGISFVSKVAPPKYKGAMMGGWFVATAIGNLLVSVGGLLVERPSFDRCMVCIYRTLSHFCWLHVLDDEAFGEGCIKVAIHGIIFYHVIII